MKNLPEVLSDKEYKKLISSKEITEEDYLGYRILKYDIESIQKRDSSIVTSVYIRIDLLKSNNPNQKERRVERRIKIILTLAKNEIRKNGLVIFCFNGKKFSIRTLAGLKKLYKATSLKSIKEKINNLASLEKYLPSCEDSEVESALKCLCETYGKTISDKQINIVELSTQIRLFERAVSMLKFYEKKDFVNIAFKSFPLMTTLMRHFTADLDDDVKELREKSKIAESLGRPPQKDIKLKFGEIYWEAYQANKIGHHKDRLAGIYAAREAYKKYAREINGDPRKKKISPDYKDRTFVEWGKFYHHNSYNNENDV